MQKLLCFIFLSLLGAEVAAQEWENIRLDKSLSILENKAYFNFPTTAKLENRSINLMAPSPNPMLETRVVYDRGNMRMVFFAQELFQIGDDQLINYVKKTNAESYNSTKVLFNNDHLTALLTTPSMHDPSNESILVNSLLVKTKDNTLFRISAFINPSAYKLKDKFTSLSEMVFNSIQKGSRNIDLKARKEKVVISSTNKAFELTLPENYWVTSISQYSFQVIRVHKFHHYTHPQYSEITLYNGFHPTPVYTEFGLSKSDGKKEKGSFLQENITWQSFELPVNPPLYEKEFQLKYNEIQKGIIIHCAVVSDDKKSLKEMVQFISATSIITNNE